jgi:hypothetical protein
MWKRGQADLNVHLRLSKKEAKIATAFLEAYRPESREDIGFAPVGLDEPYRVIISEDPIGLGGGINKYAYVGNNPVNWIDPWGLTIGFPGVPTIDPGPWGGGEGGGVGTIGNPGEPAGYGGSGGNPGSSAPYGPPSWYIPPSFPDMTPFPPPPPTAPKFDPPTSTTRGCHPNK